jgi:hypothetical protein
MSRRARILAYGAAGLLILIGASAGALISGTGGGVVAVVLDGVGLVAIVGLVFYEVGLSEDSERARELRARELTERPAKPRDMPARRLERRRGERRRLR